MRVGVIADDFTGASDIALTLAEGGLRTVLVTGPDHVPDCDAAVIALKTRTVPAADAVAQSLAALDRLGDAERVIFKVCSTFDSTPAGNIGPVAEALAERLGLERTLICPAFPEAGRRVFMGHLFVGDVPLHESGMQDHPLTPMTDPDLRRVMAVQSRWPVHHLAWQDLRAGRATMDAPGHWIADAVEESDLMALAGLDARLMVGGSGIALGLGRGKATPDWTPAPGHGAVLSGSCSRATRMQVAAWMGLRREIAAEEAAGTDPRALADWALAQDSPVLIHSSADPETVAAAQARMGTEAASEALETLFAETARALVAGGVTRLVVAGGETSGRVTEALAPGALTVGPRLAAGVPALKSASGLALALKSGNFGGETFFADALEAMG